MLVLTRRIGEKLFVNDDIVITVVHVGKHGQVKIGIEAPVSARIDREEVRDAFDVLIPEEVASVASRVTQTVYQAVSSPDETTRSQVVAHLAEMEAKLRERFKLPPGFESDTGSSPPVPGSAENGNDPPATPVRAADFHRTASVANEVRPNLSQRAIDTLADWRWVDEQFNAGAWDRYNGEFIAVAGKALLGHGPDPNRLRVEAAARGGVPADRLVVTYIDRHFDC